jgi:hypothetical protein
MNTQPSTLNDTELDHVSGGGGGSILPPPIAGVGLDMVANLLIVSAARSRQSLRQESIRAITSTLLVDVDAAGRPSQLTASSFAVRVPAAAARTVPPLGGF